MPPVSRLGFPVKSHIWLSQVIRRSVWGIGELGHIAPKVAWQSAGADRANRARPLSLFRVATHQKQANRKGLSFCTTALLVARL